MAVGRRSRDLIGPLLVVNFVVCLIVLGLAGWSLDKYIDGEQNHPRMLSVSLSLSLIVEYLFFFFFLFFYTSIVDS